MKVPTFLVRNLLFPIAELRAQNGFAREYRFLRETRKWARRELENCQKARCYRSLCHAFETVPFYREWLGDHKVDPLRFQSLEQLSDLPVLSKGSIQSLPHDRLISSRVKAKDRIPYSTSGSSGEPFEFFVSRTLNGRKIARYLREMWAWGIEPGEPFLKVWGMGRVPAPGRESEQRFFSRYILGREEESAFDLDDKVVDRLLEKLHLERLRVLEAYTSTAVHLAGRARERGMHFPHLRAVVVSGETLLPEQAETLGSAFGAPVINAYGSREFGRVAFSIRNDSRLVYSMEDFYAEYLEIDPPDPTGLKRLVLTCFSNDVQPFVRYDTGDLVEPGTSDDSVQGTGLQVWNRVAGRLAEMMTAPDGRHISVHFFTLLFEDYSTTIRQFQVVRKSNDELTLLVVPGPDFASFSLESIGARIAEYLGPTLQVRFEAVESIPITGDGKRPLIRNQVGSPHASSN